MCSFRLCPPNQKVIPTPLHKHFVLWVTQVNQVQYHHETKQYKLAGWMKHKHVYVQNPMRQTVAVC